MPIDPNLKPSKLRRRETVRARDKRAAFSVDQLREVFKNPVWTGSHSEYHQTKPGQDIFKNGIYWCPLIGAYTGARREKIAGLAPSDIIESDGVKCFSIEDSELRRIKNLSSRRLISVHSDLITLGFLNHVQEAKESKKAVTSQNFMKLEMMLLVAKSAAACAKSLIRNLEQTKQNSLSTAFETTCRTNLIMQALMTKLSGISSDTKARTSTTKFTASRRRRRLFLKQLKSSRRSLDFAHRDLQGSGEPRLAWPFAALSNLTC